MKLLAKFNLIFLTVLVAGLAVAAYFSHQFLRSNARDQVLQQARLMMETVLSMRDYTTQQIRPLLVNDPQHKRSFLPQTVPAFAAAESFAFLRKKYPDYTYKEAALNPTNPRDRAVDWEADIISTFRNHPEQKEIVGERDSATGRALFLARPMVSGKACLECHSTPQVAPAAMIRRYGTANGFGWQLNEIVAAQIVSVPMSVPVQIADKAFASLVAAMAAICLLALVILNMGLMATVVRPVQQLSRMADEISKGNLELPELPVRGKDEISLLAGAFNRMRQSLVKAMRLLE